MLNKKPKKPINISGATKKNAPGKGGGSDASRKTVLRKKPKLGTPKNAPGKGGGSDAARKGPGRKKPKLQGMIPPIGRPKKPKVNPKNPTTPEGPIRLKRGGKAKKNVK